MSGGWDFSVWFPLSLITNSYWILWWPWRWFQRSVVLPCGILNILYYKYSTDLWWNIFLSGYWHFAAIHVHKHLIQAQKTRTFPLTGTQGHTPELCCLCTADTPQCVHSRHSNSWLEPAERNNKSHHHSNLFIFPGNSLHQAWRQKHKAVKDQIPPQGSVKDFLNSVYIPRQHSQEFII